MIAVYTRSANADLWERMCEFIPYEVTKYRATGFDGFVQSADYLYWMLQHAKDNGVTYAINLDEDCFIRDWGKVLELVEYVKQNSISHAGMPDGGVHPGRTHSWAVHNPFFNVFNVAMCTYAIGLSTREDIDAFTFVNIKKTTKPRTKYAFDNNNTEPFNGLFYYLHAKGNPLNLQPYVWKDGLTTELIFNEVKFCTHTWYSRNYGRDIEQTERINKIYEYCRNRRMAW